MPSLLKELAEAHATPFSTVEAIETWFRTVLDKESNKDLVVKWNNLFDRMQCYREVWRSIKKEHPDEIIDIYRVLNNAEAKVEFEKKDEIAELTAKMTVAIAKNPKIRGFMVELNTKVHQMANATKLDKTSDKQTSKPSVTKPIPSPTQPK